MPEFTEENDSISDLDNDDELDYEHSRAFYLYLITKNSDLLAACNVIMAECYSPTELRTRIKKEAARKVIRRIVIALYKEWENDPTKFLSISLNNNDWSISGRYGKLGHLCDATESSYS